VKLHTWGWSFYLDRASGTTSSKRWGKLLQLANLPTILCRWDWAFILASMYFINARELQIHNWVGITKAIKFINNSLTRILYSLVAHNKPIFVRTRKQALRYISEKAIIATANLCWAIWSLLCMPITFMRDDEINLCNEVEKRGYKYAWIAHQRTFIIQAWQTSSCLVA